MSKKHLIFGATGAIGSSLAHQLNDVGEQCNLIGRNETELKELSSKLNCKFSICDVLDPDFTKNLKDELSTQDIAGIAYCIGSIDLKPFRLTKTKDFISCFTLNLVAVTDIIKIFEENLKKNNGSIVLFSTVAVKQGFPNHTIVSSAKGAIEGLTLALAAEFAPNVRVNCIAPSLTNSKISNFLLKNEKVAEGIAKMHPMKRIGQGEDSASVAKFLLTDESSWITGQILGVDGGRSSVA